MTKPRWIETVIEEAEKTDVKMPWTRGTRRAAWIAKRDMAMVEELARAA